VLPLFVAKELFRGVGSNQDIKQQDKQKKKRSKWIKRGRRLVLGHATTQSELSG
jgi:hypothetical protein